MKFISTAGSSEPVSFIKSAETGLAPDGGLYMPERIPTLPRSFFDETKELTLQDIAKEVTSLFLNSDDVKGGIDALIDEAINFDAPLIQIREDLFILELFHGPTLAFKDFGARFMAQLFSRAGFSDERELVILVATSGDTGGAVANGFYDVPGVKVGLLFPKGKVSDIQRKQMTTLGKNITAFEVDGVFDDCQRLVKQAFSDKKLNQKLRVSSANSINIARLIPQTFYYLHAARRFKQMTGTDPIFSVPSGNFGNLTAGLMAEKMGMPVKKFIAGTNSNDVVPKFLQGKDFAPASSVQTISNAMDVGNPSNFERMLHLFDGDKQLLRTFLYGDSFSDEETRNTIRNVYEMSGYIMDPHTAIGVLALEKYKQLNFSHDPGIVLATAHASKFRSVVEGEINGPVQIPERLASCLDKEEKSLPISSSYEEFSSALMDSFGRA